nr:hypothetical protein [uncultured bacterium]
MSRACACTSRRGFTFMLVLGLLALSVVMLGWGLERQRVQNRVVQLQIDNIERHHELLSIRDIARKWFLRAENNDDKMLEWAASAEPAMIRRMPGGRVITIRVEDGQGTVCARLDKAEQIGMRDRLLDILRRLPEGRGDLVRRSGPVKISFNGAKPEVIDALAGDDAEMGKAMHRLRAKGVADRDAFTRAMEDAGLNSEDFAWALELLDFRPTLWRLLVDVVDRGQTRSYSVLVERRANLGYVYEWRSVPNEPLPALPGDSAPGR